MKLAKISTTYLVLKAPISCVTRNVFSLPPASQSRTKSLGKFNELCFSILYFLRIYWESCAVDIGFGDNVQISIDVAHGCRHLKYLVLPARKHIML